MTMMARRCLAALAILFAAPLCAASCGGGADDTSARQPTAYPTTTRTGFAPTSDMGASPQNMPGGGRGSDAPHSKGKP